MTLTQQVLDLLAQGLTVPRIAGQLNLENSLVEAIIDHAKRLSVVTVSARSTCNGCRLSGPGCTSCPLSQTV